MTRSLPAAVRNHLAALRMLLVFTVLCGLAYPLLVTGIAQAAFPARADGSLVEADGRTVGSSLIGQTFDLPKKHPNDPNEAARPDPAYFQPRPSAGGYDPLASGASNLGPNDPGLVKAVKERRAAIAAFDGVPPADVPPDAVTASGSGLEADISTAYAAEQVDRVAEARGLPAAEVRHLVAAHTHARPLGFLGEPYVDVVTLNASLPRHG
jgi:K+-transporting ATPase ATPase C chain